MFAKRQQVVQVLFALSYGASRDARDRLEAEVPPFSLTRIKRLLEIDLRWARANPELLPRFGLAFYDQCRSVPGTRFSTCHFACSPSPWRSNSFGSA